MTWTCLKCGRNHGDTYVAEELQEQLPAIKGDGVIEGWRCDKCGKFHRVSAEMDSSECPICGETCRDQQLHAVRCTAIDVSVGQKAVISGIIDEITEGADRDQIVESLKHLHDYMVDEVQEAVDKEIDKRLETGKRGHDQDGEGRGSLNNV